MSELISGQLITGKEALIALANGEKLQAKDAHDWKDVTWDMPLAMFDTPMIVFRLKPRTIMINGIEVPAPFEPKEDCTVFIIDDGKTCQYCTYDYEFGAEDGSNWIGIWRNEGEIRQVVDALRSVFEIK